MKPALLVIYHAREPVTRQIIDAHLWCWRRHYEGQTVYVNAAFGLPKNLKDKAFAATLLHTSLFKLRWNLAAFAAMRPVFEAIAALPGPHIAMPQDEFLASEPLCDALIAAEIDVVLSCAEADAQAKIYERLIATRPNTRRETILTGYISDALLVAATQHAKPWKARTQVIGQRVWDVPHWLGRVGKRKAEICVEASKLAKRRNWPASISLNPEDTLSGADWHAFLGNCKVTIGAEGGASILDKAGEIRACAEQRPNDDTFDATEAACFPGRDGELGLSCLSPRHFEAAAMGNVQVLVEGCYNDVFVPGRHFIPVKSDLSDLEDALEQALDPDTAHRLTETARQEIALSGRYTYATFVTETAGRWFNANPQGLAPSTLDRYKWRVIDALRWQYIRLEEFYARRRKTLGPLRWLIRPLQALIGRPGQT